MPIEDYPYPIQAGDDAAKAGWWPVHDLPPLAFDHDDILGYALKRLKARLAESAQNPKDSDAEGDSQQATGFLQSD